MKRNDRHWFHCAEDYHGDTWNVPRKRPTLIGPEEPLTPRLCVARSVAACFAARLFAKDVHVYRTERVRRTVKPNGVYDAVITGERWLIPPVTMVKVATIPRHVSWEIGGYLHDWIELHNCAPTKLVRCLAYDRAIRILTRLDRTFAEPWEARFMDKAVAMFGARNTADYDLQVRFERTFDESPIAAGAAECNYA